MTASAWFWLVYVLCVLGGGFAVYPNQPTPFLRWAGFPLAMFILFGILGYAVFGSPIK